MLVGGVLMIHNVFRDQSLLSHVITIMYNVQSNQCLHQSCPTNKIVDTFKYLKEKTDIKLKECLSVILR